MYSQSKEDEIVASYFGDYVGTLAEFGSNDGQTFSNSLLLIEKGWNAKLIEPCLSVYEKSKELHKGNSKVSHFLYGIAPYDGTAVIYESGAHVKNGKDRALVSSINQKETLKWRGVDFIEHEISVITFKTWYRMAGNAILDFISIDCEGLDWIILQQINLSAVGCKCLCIEWNSNGDLSRYYSEYCAHFGLKEIHRNAENIIFAR